MRPRQSTCITQELDPTTLAKAGIQISRRGGVLPYMGYIAKCGP